jgi:probable rRNA maturation factor
MRRSSTNAKPARKASIRRPPPPAAGEFTIEIADRQRILAIDRRWLARVVDRALVAAGVVRAEIGVLLVDDTAIARLHDRWLGLPGATDVLTFDLSDGGATDVLHGDIAVSTATARRVARELGWQPRHEVAYYVVHGLLHLAGSDDRTAADRRAMRARERVVMAAAGLPRPPVARSGR